MKDSRNIVILLAAARKAREGAYSPYSRVKIGAAVLGRGGRVFSGSNVENSSYGLSVCAERVALFRAVAEGGRPFRALAIFGESEEYTLPCGACRQVMAEFNPKIAIHRRGADGFSEDTDLPSLFPRPFRPGSLLRR